VFFVALYFILPIFRVVLGGQSSAVMTVPKASIREDRYSFGWENEVGASVKVVFAPPSGYFASFKDLD